MGIERFLNKTFVIVIYAAVLANILSGGNSVQLARIISDTLLGFVSAAAGRRVN